VHEIKHDGYRMQLRKNGDRVRLFTRRGFDFVSMMRELSASIMLFGSHTETLAVALYLLWDEALFSDVSILSLVIILLTLVPIAIMRWLLKSKGIGEIAS